MALVALSLSACRTVEFYGQAVSGQLGMLAKRQPIDKVAAKTEDQKLKDRLELTKRLLDFAERELMMPSITSQEISKRFVITYRIPQPYL